MSVSDAYGVTALLGAAFEARGEKLVGRKIGLTNRQMWEAYGVEAPVWGYCTDKTTSCLGTTSQVYAANFIEPRIEPEVVFGLCKSPSPAMSESELLDCIEWVALGYEIVQSIFPEWKFAPSDAIAANAMHGALLIGKRHAILPHKARWQYELANFTVELICNDQLKQIGQGKFVLGSPLLALKHLVELLARRGELLGPDEIIATGTLTLPMAITPGEIWKTRKRGIQLDDITVQIEP